MANPTVPSAWAQGEPYERYVGRWSRRVAPVFLDWLAIPPGRDWLDVGCGTGALSGAILNRFAPSSVCGVEPSDGFRSLAAERLGDRARLFPGTATAIPLPGGSVDVVVSGLVLNFVPEVADAVTEMARVCRDGGVLAAYVWDYADGMQMMRHFWETAASLDPVAAALDESIRFALCTADGLAGLWRAGGLCGVETRAIQIATVFADFDDYWQPFLGGQGPAPAYVATLDNERKTALREALLRRLPAAADGSIPLIARAWSVRGTVAN